MGHGPWVMAITTITYFSIPYCFYLTFMAPNRVFTYYMSRIVYHYLMESYKSWGIDTYRC